MRNSQKNINSRAKLTDAQLRRLNEIGMLWGNMNDIAWENAFFAICEYKKEYGHIDVPAAYQTSDGLRLGRWIRRQREMYAEGKLSCARKERLDNIGMTWQQTDPWIQKFQLLKRYYHENGHTKMPADYVVDGVWLARWLSEQVLRLNGRRKQKKLTAEQVSLLFTVGIVPKKITDCLPSDAPQYDDADSQKPRVYSVAR